MALVLMLVVTILLTAQAQAADPDDWRALVASGRLVEVTRYDPTILVELRYATARNGNGAPLYPPDFPCLVRPAVALRLHRAQTFLRSQGYGLKIWDGYRPASAQRALFKRANAGLYVSDPDRGRGSLHSQGIAVDVTLVDLHGKEVPMPSDFDCFDATASGVYKGKLEAVDTDLQLLQYAMMRVGGFSGLSFEWWHFVDRDWRQIKSFAETP